MFDDDHEDGDDDHDCRDDDYGDDDDAHDEGGNGDDDDDGVCSQCGRDDGNPSSWKRPPTRIPPPPSLSLGISIHVFILPRERESGSRASSCPAFQTTCTLRPDTGRVVVVVGGALRHRAPAKTGPLSAKACLSLLVRRSLAGNFTVETARQPHPDSAANRARSESLLQTFTLFCRRLI